MKVKCPYCNEEMDFKSREIKDFYSYIEGLKPLNKIWNECPKCHSQCINSSWFIGNNVVLASEKQLKYIKQLFMKLKIYDNDMIKWKECNEMLYIGDNRTIKITKEKGNVVIKYLNMFKDFEDWNIRVDKYINENVKSEYLRTFLPTNLYLFIDMIDNNIMI